MKEPFVLPVVGLSEESEVVDSPLVRERVREEVRDAVVQTVVRVRELLADESDPRFTLDCLMTLVGVGGYGESEVARRHGVSKMRASRNVRRLAKGLGMEPPWNTQLR